MGAKLPKLLLIVGALIVAVLLFLAPKTIPDKSANMPQPEASSISNISSLDVYVRTAEKNMKPELLGEVEKLKTAGKYDSLVDFWAKLKRPDIASYYAEKKALADTAGQGWFDVGNRYYYSTQFVSDKTEVPLLYQGAIRSFQNALVREPNNTDIKIMLASSYVDGTQDPMKGVGMLREIEKTDSNNVKLQLTFAFFSVKSGQLEKAVTRFKKVLQLDSTYLEGYLHLADAYEQMGNSEGTIDMLERYAKRATDITAKLEVEKYIKQLKETK